MIMGRFCGFLLHNSSSSFILLWGSNYSLNLSFTQFCILNYRQYDVQSFSEGLLLSEKVGLDPKVLVEVISQGAISAPMYSMKGPSMVQSLYPTAFPLKHQQKDLRLALGLAESVSQPTPIAAAANELYKVAKARGLSDDDFSAVIEALKEKLQERS
ncbi:Glyoxylate/succinic semialdehyde reductase 2, chloroplastic [Sesamum alatum]|uniref:Glyoxylate/succinic semialdehyde reductase 2, chloroplastic n=1 Tax=Sesamum alatum TaxID=300844 RepID=A0AAE1XL87_9LAMI|nr:Glyoxylate/succinic semialdehyde reductase 2, chloroplastic [Sesamum alatum]